jgi:hypothetical protein
VALVVVEVEPWVLLAGAGAEVGGGRGGTTAADAGATATNEVGRWGRDSTPSSTLEGQLSQPSSSLLSYERGSYQP